MEKLDIFNYSDYRHFLKSFYEWRKEDNPRFSLQVWATQLEIKSKSTLGMVMAGDRKPGESLLQKLVKYFDFKESEEAYLRDLVALSHLKGRPDLYLMLVEKISNYHPYAHKGKVLDDSTFHCLSEWYYFVIREMVHLENFKEDAEWIESCLRFQVSQKKIKKAIQDLVHLGLLGRDHEGKLKVSESKISTQDEYASEAIKRYHEQILDQTKSMVRKMTPEEKYFACINFPMDISRLDESKKFLRKIEDHFISEFEKEESNSVCRLSIQFSL